MAGAWRTGTRSMAGACPPRSGAVGPLAAAGMDGARARRPPQKGNRLRGIARSRFLIGKEGPAENYSRKTTAEMVVVHTPLTPLVTHGAEAESTILPLMR